MELTEKDKRLIDEAKQLKFTEQDKIESLLKLAESDKAKKIINEIAVSLYHLEEYYADML